jgi:urease accessory protein UreH
LGFSEAFLDFLKAPTIFFKHPTKKQHLTFSLKRWKSLKFIL